MSIQKLIYREISYKGDLLHATLITVGIASFGAAVIISEARDGVTVPMFTGLVVTWGLVKSAKYLTGSISETRHIK